MPAGRPAPTALIYDWDNTLVDAWGGVTAALNVTFSAFGMPHWTDDDTKRRARLALATSFQTMFGDEWQRARDLFAAAMREGHLRHVRPMPGIEAALEAGQSRPHAIVSNKDGPFLRAEVAHLGWITRFGAIVGAGDAAADKPDAAPIHLALSRLGLPADRSVWYLGDAAIDMETARAAGVTGVLIGDASHDGGVARAAPDRHFASAEALAAALRALA
jgi:phosphoglycolate phosphatase